MLVLAGVCTVAIVLAAAAWLWRNHDSALAKELEAMAAEDARARLALPGGSGSALSADQQAALRRLDAMDERHTARLKQIIDRYGWPNRSLVGETASHDAWLLAQHADRDPAFQKRVLALMQTQPKGEVAGADVALLTDRVLVAEGKTERFATQTTCQAGVRVIVNGTEGTLAEVNARRAELGLSTVQANMTRIDRTYGHC